MTKKWWVEISAEDHQHGGPGWGIGTCLWCPVTDKSGKDRYKIMQIPAAGDCVFHLIRSEGKRRLIGMSEVSRRADVTSSEPPIAAEWAGAGKYYRTPLQNFVLFHQQPQLDAIEAVHADEIRADIVPMRPAYHPYATYGAGIRLRQGLYLAALSNLLIEIFSVYAGVTSEQDRGVPAVDHFAEGTQLRAERTFFSRNAALRQAAIEHWGILALHVDSTSEMPMVR